MTYSIVTEGLVKRFGDTVALAGVDLAVRTGSVFGLRRMRCGTSSGA
jgi:oleandomycin transport system ATP-binding protein